MNEHHRDLYAGLMNLIGIRLKIIKYALDIPYHALLPFTPAQIASRHPKDNAVKMSQTLALYQMVFTAEIVATHFRKILEGIAMGSLVAHKDKYEKISKSFQLDWNAKKIIDKVRRVNPNFFPVAKALPNDMAEVFNVTANEQIDSPTNINGLPKIEKGQLKEHEFVELYNYCSSWMHHKNPFGDDKMRENPLVRFTDYYTKVLRLLEFHRTSILDEGFYYTLLESTENGGQSMVYQFLKL